MDHQASENEKKITLTALTIPLRVFVLFLAHNQKQFTVSEIQEEFNKLYKVELSYNRMKQILDDLCLSENLAVEQKPNGSKNKITSFYTFKSIM